MSQPSIKVSDLKIWATWLTSASHAILDMATEVDTRTSFLFGYIFFLQKDVRALPQEAEHIGKNQIIVSQKNVQCDLSISRGEEKQETAGCGGVSEDSH